MSESSSNEHPRLPSFLDKPESATADILAINYALDYEEDLAPMVNRLEGKILKSLCDSMYVNTTGKGDEELKDDIKVKYLSETSTSKKQIAETIKEIALDGAR